MHEYKSTNIKSTRYPVIYFKKLRICCIANFGSKKNLFSSHIKRCGKAGYTRVISVPIPKSNKINHENTCFYSHLRNDQDNQTFNV